MEHKNGYGRMRILTTAVTCSENSHFKKRFIFLKALYFLNPNITYEEKIRGKREETREAGMMRIQTFITMYVTPQNMRLSMCSQ